MKKGMWWRALLAPSALVALTITETLLELAWRIWISLRAVAIWVLEGTPLPEAYCDCLKEKIASNKDKIDRMEE